MSRSEFSKKTKLEAWNRCKGICECGCQQKIIGRPDYDHLIPDGLGGDNSLENCRVLMPKHHAKKTHEQDNPMMSKADRLREKAAGIRKTKRKMSYRKFDGTPVWNR